MAGDESDKGSGKPQDRRPPQGSRRKPQPITIDLAASSVRLENTTVAPSAGETPTAPINNPFGEAPVASQTGVVSDDLVGGEPAMTEATSSEPAAKPDAVEPRLTSAAAGTAAEGTSEPAAVEPNEDLSQHPAVTAVAEADAMASAETSGQGPVEPPSEPPHEPPRGASNEPPRRDIWPQMIAASLVGGAIGLIAAYGLASAGLWPGANSGPTTVQIAALEARLAATEAKVGPNGQLATELDHLKSMPSIPGVTISDVEKILDPFTAKTAAAVAHMDDIDKKIAGEQAIVRGEVKVSQETLTTKMTALDNSVSSSAATTNQLKDAVTKLQQDLGALDKKTGDEVASAQGQLSSTIQALSARVNDLDTRSAADFAVLRGGASKVADEIAKAYNTIGDQGTDLANLHKTLADGADGIAKLQAQLQPMDDMRKAIDGLGARIGAVDDVKAILAQQNAKLNTADDAKKAADGVAASLWIIDQRMANLQARMTEVDALKASLTNDSKDIAALQAKLGPMETKVAGLDGYAKQGLDARKDAVAAVAISNLKTAADSGQPFVNELAAAKAIVGNTVDLAPLQRYADKGLVSDAKLTEGFDSASRQISDALTPVAANDGILGALLSHAVSSVKVTPASAEAGDSTAARLSRIAAKLKVHDMAGALAEWQALPEAGRRASEEWGKALETHVDGAKAVDAISDQVMTKLTSASQ
jgi:hypothetical protein